MKFTIAKTSLQDALTSVSRAASNFSPLPILSGIKFELYQDTLILIASDSNISIKEIVPANETTQLMIEEEGSLVLESRYVLEAVRKIESDSITIEILDGALTRISAHKTEYIINGSKADLFPSIDFSKPEQEFRLPGKTLLEIISQTAFVCANNEERPIFTGVNFQSDGTNLLAVATDSYRLAKKQVEVENLFDFNISIPASNLYEVAKSIVADDDVIIAISNRIVQFYLGDTLIQSRLIDGLFPDVDRLIPESFTFELSVDTHDLVNAIDRSSFLKSEGYWTVKLEATTDRIIISSKSQEIGSSQEELKPIEFKGGTLKISFSGRFMIEALKSFKAEVVKIYFVNETSGFVLKNPNDDSILQLISPVRTFD